MTTDQAIVFAVLAVALVLFIRGPWRYDIVALLALLALVFADIVPKEEAFTGFGNPVVIIVAAVLVVSQGLRNSGVVDFIAGWLSRLGRRPSLQVAGVTAVTAVVAAFVSTIGAVAVIMPVAIRLARRNGYSPSRLLMPMSFASLLGAMTTLLHGPNIVIASFRAQTGAGPFHMFDFSPVGVPVALAGILFISLIGWRLTPQRKGRVSREALFQVENYVAELRVPEASKVTGRRLRQLEDSSGGNISVVGLVRGEQRIPAPSGLRILRPGDILIVRADSEQLKDLINATGLELLPDKKLDVDLVGWDELGLMEAVVMPSSPIEGRTARGLNLRSRYGVNLIAVARQSVRLQARPAKIRFRVGDVLLLQGPTETVLETIPDLGCLPLAERGLRLGQPRRFPLAIAIFGAALATSAADFLPVEVAFGGAAVLMVVLGLLTLREAYESIDWSLIVLLGAMLPVGKALETTGAAELVATRLINSASDFPPGIILAIILVATMALTPLISNAATALLMAPVAISVAKGLDTSADPFLIAVALGASVDFLTPIGHQTNTLVWGPGGYRFGDYWRMGLPLEVLVAVVAVPLILLFWPL